MLRRTATLLLGPRRILLASAPQRRWLTTAVGHLQRGIELLEAGDAAAAVVALQSAAAADASCATSRYNLAHALMLEKRVPEAVVALHESAALDARPDTLVNLGNLLALGGDLPAAVAKLRMAATLDPTDWQIQFNLAVVLEKSGDLLEAAKTYQVAKKVSPGPSVDESIDMHLRNVLAKAAGPRPACC